MNKISKSEYDQVKNEAVSLISFSATTQTRHAAHGNISYIDAVKEMMRLQKGGLICMIVENKHFDALAKYEYENKVDRITIIQFMGVLNQ